MTRKPGDDPFQAIRIRRFFIAVAAYIIWLLLIIYCYHLGLIRLSIELAFLFYSVFIVFNIGIYVLLRTGLNRRLADPSLTFVQMVAATIGAMFVIYFTDQVRALMLLIYFMTFIFGVFRFNTRQFFSFALFTLCSYGLVVLALSYNHPEKVDPRIEVLQLLVFGTVLFWFSIIGSYISSLRNRLSAANRKLGHALTTIEALAIHDDLTQVYNRRHMFQELQRVKSLADRSGIPFSIAIFDLDHFKQVNDTFGHQKGDDVLKKLVRDVAGELRDTDMIARYGGEEFLVIMPGTDISGAAECAQRIQKSVCSASFAGFPDSFQVTISTGITSYRPVESIDEMIYRADNALYRAKANGRNRVEIDFPEPASQKMPMGKAGAIS
ncbi:MAG: GGDEF domain-containing protein [Thermodesulfobacteriota bacterium]